MPFYMSEKGSAKVYPTPTDERQAMRMKLLAYVAWVATFASLGVLLALGL